MINTVNEQGIKRNFLNLKYPELTFVGWSKKQKNSRKTSTFALLTMPRPLTVWIRTNWKILQEMGIPDHLTCLLRNLHAGQEQQLELDREQWTGSKLGKEYIQAVYCHPAYLTYMQNTSWETLGLDEAQAGIKTARSNIIPIDSDMQMTPPLWQKVKRN